MGPGIAIRRADHADAAAISAVITSTLTTSNAADYPATEIERLRANFTPASVLAMIERRIVFVAFASGRIVGTAGVEGDAVRTVFVLPDFQGREVGRRLMSAVEQAARDAGTEVLRVQSSLTARDFYARLGYRAVREVRYGEERTVVMERRLLPVAAAARIR